MIIVTSTAGLLAALKVATAGAVIALNPGVYTPVITNFNGSVTIQSNSTTSPARLLSLTVYNSSGITFKNLEFDASLTPPTVYGAGATIPFQVISSNHMTFSFLNVHGSPHGSLATDVSGLLIRDSSNMIVNNSNFQNLHNGLEHLNVNGFVVSANHFHLLRDDGLRGGGSNYVTVQNNTCDSLHMDGAADPDHPDCVEFWTTNTTTIAHDITVTGNTYTMGTGTPVQGIFFRDIGGTLPFNRVTISNNTIRDAAWDGIYVMGGTNFTVTGNTVCQAQGQASWMDIFNVTGLTMSNNHAPMFNFTGVSNKTETADVLNQGFC